MNPDLINTPEFVAAIKAQDPEAEARLYKAVMRFRFAAFKFIHEQDTHDVLHDAFIHVCLGIRKNQVQQPAALLGYIATVVKRAYLQTIAKYSKSKSRYCSLDQHSYLWDIVPDVEANQAKGIIERETVTSDQILFRVLLGRLREIDRELLERFYLKGQPATQVQKEMRLTKTQFRLRKSRAKLMLEESVRHYRTFGKLPESIPATFAKSRNKLKPLPEGELRDSLLELQRFHQSKAAAA